MKTRSLLLSCARSILFAALPVIGSAQGKTSQPADPNAFSTRVYRLPARDLSDGFLSNDRGELRAPTLPSADVSSGEIEAFIKRSHDVTTVFLRQQGITLQKGSLACFDPATGTLALRAPNIIHEIVTPFTKALARTLPKDLSWSLSILELKLSVAREAMKMAAGTVDHTGVFEQLQPNARVVVSMRGEAKPGFQTKAVQGAEAADLVGFSLGNNNRIKPSREKNLIGTELELEPAIHEEEEEIDLNLALRHRHSAGTPRQEKLITSLSDQIEAHWVDRPLAAIKTSITMKSGTTRFLGAWALDGDALAERAELVRIAFIRAAIVNVQPLDDGRVAQFLQAHGEAVEPTPKHLLPVSKSDIPKGMSVRRFRVPPDFLSTGDSTAGSAPIDPFAPPKASDSKQKPRKTAQEILRDQGIPFPPGSSANFYEQSSELVVWNTQDALDLVETFCCNCDDKPRLLSFSLHIVQADALLLRKLDRETSGLADHTAAWKEVEDAVVKGSAKIVRSAWIETKSGQPTSTESIVEFRQLESDADESPTTETQVQSTPGGKPKSAIPVVTSRPTGEATSHEHKITSVIRPCGLRLDLEPTVGADGRTIDLNLSFGYDYAPPVQRVFDEPMRDHSIRVAAPSTEFRTHEF